MHLSIASPALLLLSLPLCILSILHSSISFYRFVILRSGLGGIFFFLFLYFFEFEFSSSGIVYVLLFSVLLKCLLKKYCFNYWKFEKAKCFHGQKRGKEKEFLPFLQHRWINNKWITTLLPLPYRARLMPFVSASSITTRNAAVRCKF